MSIYTINKGKIINVYNVYFRTQDELINLGQLVNFMNEKQRDPCLNEILYPLYNDERCIEIINTYEQKPENKDNSMYCTYT